MRSSSDRRQLKSPVVISSWGGPTRVLPSAFTEGIWPTMTKNEANVARIEPMAKDFKDVFRDAIELPEHDRAALGGLLIESLEGEPDPDAEAAWSVEIERRVQELDAGTVKAIPWDEVRQRLLHRLNAR
jgi:putative addiction module component (TIGR02574 family)